MKIDPTILILAFRSFGVKFEKYDVDQNLFCISVPETSEYCNANGLMMSGRALSKKLKELLLEYDVHVDVAYRLRPGHWTRAIGQQVIAQSLENMDPDSIARILEFGEQFENFEDE